ncbi:uncharacterized protein NPIL_54351 [Nephila pilipes]|uniref:Uncharacterized protein n=1 Tax=Nephila pilipes TaxID=299642 RepID=A0A8X6KJL6_NEPPI|nr:uncharacterized protein NPIL_54351 [Nephila pilipes]
MQSWKECKDYIGEDILHRMPQETNNHSLDFTEEIYIEALILIDDHYLAMCGKLLAQMGVTAPNRSINATFERELLSEQSYNTHDLHFFVQENTPKLFQEQNIAFDTITQAVANKSNRLYFFDVPG